MAAKTSKDLAPVLKLLDVSKAAYINKQREEKILPLLKKFSSPHDKSELEVTVDEANEAMDAVNTAIDKINNIYSSLINSPGYRVYSRYSRFSVPSGSKYSYALGNTNYCLTKEQYNEILTLDGQICEAADLRYLTLETRITLENDFKEIAKILSDNGILFDSTVK